MKQFNQDISYWYNRSTKRWYCDYTTQLRNDSIFTKSKNEAWSKAEILEMCETMARWYHAA